jgi:CRP-like cAMP-binding protein
MASVQSPRATTTLSASIAEAFPQSRFDTRRALTTAVRIRAFGPGQAILRQGDDVYLALVLDGQVAMHRTTLDGRELIVRIVPAGGLGSILPLDDRPAAAAALGITPGSIALWPAGEVRSLAAADAGFAVDLLGHVLGIFETVVGRLDGMLHQDARRRVARVLDEYADLFFGEGSALTRAYLPLMVGTSREMTGRVLRLFESEGILRRVGRDRLRLLDPAGLTAAAGWGTDRVDRWRDGQPGQASAASMDRSPAA